MESIGRQKERGRSPGNPGKSKKGRSKPRFRKKECWNYGKKGHLNKDCKEPKKKGERQQETTQEANVASDVLQDALILALDNTSDYWVVSRASCQVILNMFYWEMINHIKLLERVRYELS